MSKTTATSDLAGLTGAWASIYRKTYWGVCRNDDAPAHVSDPTIIRARNAFAKKYEITGVIKEPVPPHRLLLGLDPLPAECIINSITYGDAPYGTVFDHVEIYKTKHKSIVFVVSPYLKRNCPIVLLATAKDGWGMKLATPMYSTISVTLTKELKDMEAFKVWLVSLWEYVSEYSWWV